MFSVKEEPDIVGTKRPAPTGGHSLAVHVIQVNTILYMITCSGKKITEKILKGHDHRLWSTADTIALDKMLFFFQIKSTDIFLISSQKHLLWVLVRSASAGCF